MVLACVTAAHAQRRRCFVAAFSGANDIEECEVRVYVSRSLPFVISTSAASSKTTLILSPSFCSAIFHHFDLLTHKRFRSDLLKDCGEK